MIKNKIGALLGCLLLIAAATPLVLAHQTSPSAVSDALTGDEWRHSSTPAGTDGVSGNYAGSVGFTLVSEEVFGSTDPVSGSFALCDLEVLGDGSSPDPLDESTVEGGPDGGMVPDGTWDDGGVGAACHTNGHYGLASYETAGCYGNGYAKDAVSGEYVWITAACDWKAIGGGDGFVTCVVNEIISDPDTAALAVCVTNLINGQTSGGTFLACGGDGSADYADFGTGSPGASLGNAEPQIIADGCDQDDASAAIFTNTYGGSGSRNPIVPATAGWIDNDITATDTPPKPSFPVTWQGAATVVAEGFPASADEGFVRCSESTGSGQGGFCIHDSSVQAVYVEDYVLGSDLAFQVCRDNSGDGICTNEETVFSHNNIGQFRNPVNVPSGDGQIVVFVCKGAHNLPSSQGPHPHDAIRGFAEARDVGQDGFDATNGYCGGSTGGGGANPPPAGKRYVITPP